MDKSKFAVDTYEKIAGVYTKQYFEDLTDTPYIDKFLEKLPKGANVLDVGCGPGQFSKYIASKGFSVVGIDLSEEMLKKAKEKVPKLYFKKMDMRKMEYDNNTFDGLLVAYSLIHIPSDEIDGTIKEFNRILKRGGYTEIIAQKGKADKIVKEPMMRSEKTFINFFTKKKLTKYLQKANFNIVYIEEAEMQDTESLSDKVIYAIAQKL